MSSSNSLPRYLIAFGFGALACWALLTQPLAKVVHDYNTQPTINFPAEPENLPPLPPVQPVTGPVTEPQITVTPSTRITIEKHQLALREYAQMLGDEVATHEDITPIGAEVPKCQRAPATDEGQTSGANIQSRTLRELFEGLPNQNSTVE